MAGALVYWHRHRLTIKRLPFGRLLLDAAGELGSHTPDCFGHFGTVETAEIFVGMILGASSQNISKYDILGPGIWFIGDISYIYSWLVVEPTPLKNDGVPQWEGWHPIYEMENKKCSKPPTRIYRAYHGMINHTGNDIYVIFFVKTNHTGRYTRNIMEISPAIWVCSSLKSDSTNCYQEKEIVEIAKTTGIPCKIALRPIQWLTDILERSQMHRGIGPRRGSSNHSYWRKVVYNHI